MEKKKQDDEFEKAFEEMMKSLNDLPPEVVAQIKQNMAKTEKENKSKNQIKNNFSINKNKK